MKVITSSILCGYIQDNKIDVRRYHFVTTDFPEDRIIPARNGRDNIWRDDPLGATILIQHVFCDRNNHYDSCSDVIAS